MTRVLVLYYSSYGQLEIMANAVAEGVRRAGGEAFIKRVPELVPNEIARASGYKEQSAPIVTVDELPDYDAIIVGAPARYGHMASQMSNFWDQTGRIWLEDKLVGKVGAAFTSTASQHGGHEITLFAIITQLLHLGMVVTGLPYSFTGQLRHDEVAGGSPYGASTIAGADHSRLPSETDLDGARYLGRHAAELAAKLKS